MAGMPLLYSLIYALFPVRIYAFSGLPVPGIFNTRHGSFEPSFHNALQ